jgi:Icc-related predicted phosphoesterase
MRVFALSDIHVDFEVNARWVAGLSSQDYQGDLLVLAGDVTDLVGRLQWCLSTLASRFRKVLFVPGNHELWVIREAPESNSLQKFAQVVAIAESSGVSMQPWHESGLSIYPLFGWYDYSFGEPSEELQSVWMDFHACRWPNGFAAEQVAVHFDARNAQNSAPAVQHSGNKVITFSHFMPRIDLLPAYVPAKRRMLDPILGSTRLEQRLRQLQPSIHIYGHSHINRNVEIDGVTYINNAFGYPDETRIAAKRLLCIHEC